MPWRPLPRIAFAVAIFPFQPSSPADLPLELGDELYIIEQGGKDGAWYRGYLVAPPSLLAGLTSVKGQTLEARVFSGIFPRNCVEVREVLGGAGNGDSEDSRPSTVMRNGETPDRLSARLAMASSPNSVSSDRDPSKRASQVNGSNAKTLSAQFSLPAAAPRDPDAPKPSAPVPMLKIGDETPTSAAEPLVDEIASCLREWHSTNLHELLLARKYHDLARMSATVSELDTARRQLLHNVLTAHERTTLRERVIWKLVEANKMLSGDVIVRDPSQRGRLLTGEDSAVELSKLQATMSALPRKPEQKSDQTSLYHLLFDMKSLAGSASESVFLNIYLCLKSDDGSLTQLSETYSMELDSIESFSSLAQHNKVKTLFTDVKTADDQHGPRIFLVIKVSASQSPRKTFRPQIQRPPPSKDAGMSRQGTAKGSLKARRSMMWNPKTRAGTSDSQETARPPTQTSEYSDTMSTKDETKVIRTVGVGVMEIGSILRQSTGVEHVINIWSPLGDSEEVEDDEVVEEHGDILNDVLRSNSGRYKKCPQAARAMVYLHPFTDADAEHLVEKNPTLMHLTTKTRKIGFSEAPTKPRSDIYVTLMETAIPEPRPLLSHPQNGLVQLAQGSELLNLQLTLEVRDANGVRIDRCIYPSSNSQGLTAWRTTVTQRGVPWNQTIRLDIPADLVPGAHMIMSVANAPEFPFALSWMPLWDNEAFIRDDGHMLIMHAYDKTTSSMENGRGAYLDLPWSFRGDYSNQFRDDLVAGPVASVTLSTYLCSTEFSQDQVVLGLINWKNLLGARVLDLLKRLSTVNTIEIVKQLGAVLDALFGILVDNAGKDEYEDLVFDNLVTVLDTVHDRRFNTGPIIDSYADSKFNFPFSSACLIRSYLRLLLPTNDKARINRLYAALKVGNYILKFIVRANRQQRAKEEAIGITKGASAFSRDIQSIFKALENHMMDQTGHYLKIRTRATQYLHTWLPELLGAFEKKDVIEVAISFVESCSNVKSLLIQYKIILLLNYTKLDIFSEPDARRLLVLKTIDWLAPYWGASNVDTGKEYVQWRDQVRLCASVVAEQLSMPIPELYGYMPKIVASYCTIESMPVLERQELSLLFPKTIKPPMISFKEANRPQQFEEALVELSALVAAISKISDPAPLSLSATELEVFLLRALDAQASVLACEAYPKSWLSLHIYNHKAVLRNLEQLSSILLGSFLPPAEDAESFNTELWKGFFTLLLKLVSSDTLALETFPEQKRRAVWKIAGDVREFGADLLRKTWSAIGWEADAEDQERYGLEKLGGYQVQYVPSLVQPILGLCLSVHEGLRHVAVEVLQTMIISEWALGEDLSMFQAEVITSLDTLFKSKHVNENLTQKLFLTELLDLFEPVSEDADDELFNAVNDLVAIVDELFDLLIAVYSASALTESFNKLKLMNFMRQKNKDDIFVRYVHELARDQAASRHYTEAGLAIRFHADLYRWSTTKIVPALVNPSFPEQTAFERKEALYFDMIQYFEDGKAWSHVLASYKELAQCYETVTFDYSKLSRTQHSMAKVHELIVRDEKPSTRYFRVVYKGLGFPTTIREKQFIFEGMPSERMAAFTDRMQKMHPTAQVVSNTEDVDDIEGQFLQITSLSPHRELLHPIYRRARVPASVRENILVSSPMYFCITSKRQTTGSDVKQQWVEKTMFKTVEPFPNILKRSEIESMEEVKLTPLQTAVERTWRKTQELLILQKRSADGDDDGFATLTEVLTQLIDLDSPTATCVAAYREFLQPKSPIKVDSDGEEFGGEDAEDEIEEEDSDNEEVDEVKLLEKALQVALVEHAMAIKKCLGLYYRPAHQATQSQLTQRFEAVFAPELAVIAPALLLPENIPLPDDTPKVGTSDKISRMMSPEPRIKGSKHGNGASVSSFGLRGFDSGKESAPIANGHKANRLSLNPFKRTAPVLNERKYEPEVQVHPVETEDLYIAPEVNEHPRSYTPAARPSMNGSEDGASSRSRSNTRGQTNAERRRSFLGAFGVSSHHHTPQSPPYQSPDLNAPTTMTTIKTQTEPLPPPSASDTDGASTNGGGRDDDYGGAYSSRTRRPVTSDSDHSRPDGYTNGHDTGSAVAQPKKTVRKRFSILKMGRKQSGKTKLGAGEDIIEEEDFMQQVKRY